MHGTEAALTIASEEDIVRARQAARQAARNLGFGALDQSRIATAVSELTRNVVRYAIDGKGDLKMRSIDSPPRGIGLEIVVADQGPGIPDIEKAMQRGFTSGPGLGMGLPGTRRLMDEMRVESGPGGTTVTVRKWIRNR